MRRVAAIAALLALAPDARVLGDEDVTGTIPEEVTPVPDGGIAPREPTDIRLSSASIEIGLQGDGRPQAGWRVSYELSNPGAARDLRVGFRFAWYTEHKRHGVPMDPLRPASAVTINEREAVLCQSFSDVRWVDVPTRSTESSGHASGWCEFTIQVPAGASRWTFSATGDAGLVGFGSTNAGIAYPLVGEAAWPRKSAKVQVVVAADASWRWPLLPVSPPGALVAPRRIVWGVDPARDSGIVATFDRAGEVSRGAPVVVGGTGYSATASTTLKPQGRFRYDASNVVDGIPGTAWCEGAPGAGMGEWVEVRTNLDDAAAKRCRLEGFEVVPGDAVSDAAWNRNARPTRYRIASCADPGDGIEVKVFGDGEPRLVYPSLQNALDAKRGPPLAGEPRCYRFTILDVARGKDPDACVGDFLPLLTCGH